MKSPDDIWMKADGDPIKYERLVAQADYLDKIAHMLAPYADQGHSETLTDLLKRLLKELDRYREADRQIDLNEYEIWD